jgi:F0F1-type ATP synthase assembly protein I
MKMDMYENYEDLDEMFSEMEHNEKSKRNKFKNAKQKKKNQNDKDFHQSQRLPAGWREGDSHIGRAKKERNYNN